MMGPALPLCWCTANTECPGMTPLPRSGMPLMPGGHFVLTDRVWTMYVGLARRVVTGIHGLAELALKSHMGWDHLCHILASTLCELSVSVKWAYLQSLPDRAFGGVYGLLTLCLAKTCRCSGGSGCYDNGDGRMRSTGRKVRGLGSQAVP